MVVNPTHTPSGEDGDAMDHRPFSTGDVYSAAFITIATIAALLASRIVHVVRSIHHSRRHNAHMRSASATAATPTRQRQVKVMVVLGSGGHTTEMMRLLQELDTQRYAPVSYVVADSDTTSIPRLKEYAQDDASRLDGTCAGNERKCKRDRPKNRWEGRAPVELCSSGTSQYSDGSNNRRANVHRLPRAREVHQSYLSSIFTTIHSFLQTLILLRKVKPGLILANGPGTCVPIIYSAFLMRVVLGGLGGMGDCKVVFVESLCRVKTLSLTGKLAYPIADRFLVHWPSLKERYPMAEICDVFVRQ